MMTDRTWFGHDGYGGQFMRANPETGTVAVYFSVLEDKDAYDPQHSAPLIRMLEEVAATCR